MTPAKSGQRTECPLRPPCRPPSATAVPAELHDLARPMALGVATRIILEWLLDGPTIDLLAERAAPAQYTRELAMGTIVRLMIQVSAGNRATVFAACRSFADPLQPGGPQITASYQALYAKDPARAQEAEHSPKDWDQAT